MVSFHILVVFTFHFGNLLSHPDKFGVSRILFLDINQIVNANILRSIYAKFSLV